MSSDAKPSSARSLRRRRSLTGCIKHSWRIYCLDKRTGKIIWEKVAHEGVPKTKRHPKSSQASATPATDGKHVVAFFGSEGLYSYDADGKLLWKQDLGSLNAGWFYDPDYEWGIGSSPIIYKNLVIVQCDIQKNSFVAAYDINDGHRVWLTPREEIPSWGTPTIYEGQPRAELITHATKFIRAYDPMTGKELWRLSGNSEVTTPTPFVAHNLIFVTNGYRVVQPIYAIRAGGSGDITLKDGQESSDFIAWSKKRGGPYMSTPVVYGDYLYLLYAGIVTCYNAKTGERLYQQRLVKVAPTRPARSRDAKGPFHERRWRCLRQRRAPSTSCSPPIRSARFAGLARDLGWHDSCGRHQSVCHWRTQVVIESNTRASVSMMHPVLVLPISGRDHKCAINPLAPPRSRILLLDLVANAAVLAGTVGSPADRRTIEDCKVRSFPNGTMMLLLMLSVDVEHEVGEDPVMSAPESPRRRSGSRWRLRAQRSVVR